MLSLWLPAASLLFALSFTSANVKCLERIEFSDDVQSLKCFSCTSSQPGCGVNSVDMYLQGWKTCEGTATEDAMCVKIVDTVGSWTTVTRGCLKDLMKQTMIRYDAPSVRRHSYCVPAKSDPTYGPSYITSLTNKYYCFCNDLWICNGSSRVSPMQSLLLTAAFLLAKVVL